MNKDLDYLYTNSRTADKTPFTVWLEASKENELLEAVLTEEIPVLKLFKKKNEKLKILDIGCSWGSTSFRLMRALDFHRLAYRYYALDPFQEQLKQFQEIAARKAITDIEFICSTLEDFSTSEKFDLVFSSHALYYTGDIEKSLRKLMELGKEVIIVHQGEGGINIIHNRFAGIIQTDFHINTTSKDLENLLLSILPDKKYHLKTRELTAEVDVSACKNRRSETGHKLISFFMENEYKKLPDKVKQEVHSFFAEFYPEKLKNNTGILLISPL